jgi:hypothetical protein
VAKAFLRRSRPGSVGRSMGYLGTGGMGMSLGGYGHWKSLSAGKHTRGETSRSGTAEGCLSCLLKRDARVSSCE